MQQLESMSEGEMYTVETILDKREGKKKGKFEYLVKWEGWDVKDCTWQPESNLRTVKHIIEKFEKKLEKSNESKNIFNYEALGKPQKNDPFLTSKDAPWAKKKKISKNRKGENKNDQSLRNEESENDEEEEKVMEKEIKKIGKKNDDTSDSLEGSKPAIKIHGMRKQESDFWFYISEGEIYSWVLREYIVKNYPVQLCEFYEARMVIE